MDNGSGLENSDILMIMVLTLYPICNEVSIYLWTQAIIYSHQGHPHPVRLQTRNLESNQHSFMDSLWVFQTQKNKRTIHIQQHNTNNTIFFLFFFFSPPQWSFFVVAQKNNKIQKTINPVNMVAGHQKNRMRKTTDSENHPPLNEKPGRGCGRGAPGVRPRRAGGAGCAAVVCVVVLLLCGDFDLSPFFAQHARVLPRPPGGSRGSAEQPRKKKWPMSPLHTTYMSPRAPGCNFGTPKNRGRVFIWRLCLWLPWFPSYSRSPGCVPIKWPVYLTPGWGTI